MNSGTGLFVSFGIGIVTGLRSMTAPALVAWAMAFHWLKVPAGWLSFFSYPVTRYLFLVFALGELVADKIPKTPSRTAAGPLGARIVFGAVTGAAVAAGSDNSAWAAACLGALGALVGAFGGYQARARAVRTLHIPDFPVALIEDLVAVGGGLLLLSRL